MSWGKTSRSAGSVPVFRRKLPCIVTPCGAGTRAQSSQFGQRRQRIDAVSEIEPPIVIRVGRAVFVPLAKQRRTLKIRTTQQKIDVLPARFVQRAFAAKFQLQLRIVSIFGDER